MAEPSRNEQVGRDEITQLPGIPRPPSAGSSTSYQQRSTANAPPIQRRPPSIRLRRLPSTPAAPLSNAPRSSDDGPDQQGERVGRRRARSAPMRPNLPPELTRQATATTHLPALTEESSGPQFQANAPPATTDGHVAPLSAPSGRRRSGSQRLRQISSNLGARFAPVPAHSTPEDEYEPQIVDLLDVVGA